MMYQGTSVRSVVAVPTSDSVVGVQILSASHILPLIKDGPVPPPIIPLSYDRHIIRTPDSVVVVEVSAEMTVYPRTVDLSAVEESVRSSFLDALEEEGISPSPGAYARGLRAMTQRLANRMRQCGVEVT